MRHIHIIGLVFVSPIVDSSSIPIGTVNKMKEKPDTITHCLPVFRVFTQPALEHNPILFFTHKQKTPFLCRRRWQFPDAVGFGQRHKKSAFLSASFGLPQPPRFRARLQLHYITPCQHVHSLPLPRRRPVGAGGRRRGMPLSPVRFPLPFRVELSSPRQSDRIPCRCLGWGGSPCSRWPE